MSFLQILRFLNTIIPVASIPFSLFILKSLIKERTNGTVVKTRRGLKGLFAFLAFAALFNALLAAYSFISVSIYGELGRFGIHPWVNLRSLFINISILLTVYKFAEIVRNNTSHK